MDARIKKLVTHMDLLEFYREEFDDWDGKSNLRCPFAEKRHERGEDRNPSFAVFLDTGGFYCHACGVKGGNPAAFWATLKGIPEDAAIRTLWSRHVERLVPDEEWAGPARKLQQNPVVLKRLLDYRGLTRATAVKYHLGYDGKRLTIPVFNEEGFCVNIRRYDLYKSGGPKMVSWKPGFGGARLYPAGHVEQSPVFVVEGELDAILGNQMGLACYSPAGGALTWREEWSKGFAGKDVYIVPDSDRAGLEGAEKRRTSIARHAARTALVRLPSMQDGGKDLTDWVLRHGGTAERLSALATAAAGTQGGSGPSGPRPTPAREGPGAPTQSQALLDLKGGTDENRLVDRARTVWAHLEMEGKFFRGSEGELFYVREGAEPVRVTDAPGPFMALLTRLSPLLNQATLTGKFVYKYIQNNSYAHGGQSKSGVWSLYHEGALYLNAGGGDVVKVKDGKCETIKNAVNEDRVLLDEPVKAMAMPKTPASLPGEGLNDLRTIFMENLPACDEDRYLVVCWLLGVFLRNMVRPKPIVRLLASTASGKSTASKLVSFLIYGEELLSHSASTLAATYAMSSHYPFLILDNLETGNMTPELTDFLLITATGGMKVKRQASTDTGLVMERTDCLVLTNGIEPFNRHELIDRTIEIGLDIKEYGKVGFHESRVVEALRRARPRIMSAVLHLLSKSVLPRIEAGDVGKIIREFGPHGKERFNEYLAVMALFLDAIWPYMPLGAYARPHDLVSWWLDSQTRALETQDVGTDDVLYYLNTLRDKHAQVMGTNLVFEQGKGGVALRCTTRELLTDFRVLAKFLGTRCPWANERHLGTRLADSGKTLRKAGWEHERRRVHGRDEHILRRTI